MVQKVAKTNTGRLYRVAQKVHVFEKYYHIKDPPYILNGTSVDKPTSWSRTLFKFIMLMSSVFAIQYRGDCCHTAVTYINLKQSRYARTADTAVPFDSVCTAVCTRVRVVPVWKHWPAMNPYGFGHLHPYQAPRAKTWSRPESIPTPCG